MPTGPSSDWMSRGGAFWILGIEVLMSALFFAGAGLFVGKATRHQNDGCILAIVNVFAALCGGGIGFWCAKYPLFVMTALVGTVVAPLLVSLFAIKKFK